MVTVVKLLDLVGVVEVVILPDWVVVIKVMILTLMYILISVKNVPAKVSEMKYYWTV